MPGCIIRWRFDTQIGGNPTEDGACFLQAAPGVSNVRWSGSVFRSIWDERTVGGTTHRQYPFGPVFHLLGNDILFEDVVIDGYGGIAVIVAGNDIRMVNPVIRNPQKAIPADGPDVPAVKENGAGIRVYAGRGFRCRGGVVDAGNDAPLQFATDRNFEGPIVDGLFQDMRCSALSGRVLLVASKNKPVENVRFIGITGQKQGAGQCISVQVTNGPDGPGRRIAGVVFRDIVVGSAGPPGSGARLDGPAINIENRTIDPKETISDVLFENVTVTTPARCPFASHAVQEAGTPLSGKIRRVTWRGGTMTIATGGTPPLGFRVSHLEGGLFQGLHLRTSPDEGEAAAISLGAFFPFEDEDDDPPELEGLVGCRDVVLADVTVTGVKTGRTGVFFGKATDCGVVRGRIAGAAAQTGGVRMDADSVRCFVQGTDVSALTAPARVQIAPGAVGSRARDLFGTRLSVPARTMGDPAEAPLSGAHAIAAASGLLAVRRTTGAAPPIALTDVTGGRPGTMLMLTRSADPAALPISARDNTGNLRLRANCLLDAPGDVLALVATGTGTWGEVSRAENT